MNKKLINLAVAAVLAAPAAAMAEATLYGKLHISVDYIDQDDINQVLVTETGDRFRFEGDGFSGWAVGGADGNLPRAQTILIIDEQTGEVADLDALDPELAEVLGNVADRLAIDNGPVGRSNRVGVKGSEDLGGGLKAIYQVEFGIRLADGDFNAANGDRGSAVNMRNSFVGLAGGYGTFLVGRHDTPLKISTGKLDMFADTIADYNGPLAFNDVRADNVVAYISPNFGGFQLAGAVHAGGGATTGQGYNVKSDSLAEAWSIAGIYSNGPFYASAAYEVLGEDMGTRLDSDLDVLDLYDDFTKWRIGLGILDWNGFSLTGIYEDRNNTGFLNDQDSSSWQVQAGYAFGNNMVKASYGSLDRDLDFGGIFADVDTFGGVRDAVQDALDGDLNQWTIAFDHNFSKRTKAYALYTNIDDDAAPDWDSFSLGIVHSF